MEGRTYKYFRGEPLYLFGYGLSYTTFKYSDLKVVKKAKVGDKVMVSVKVTNTGKRAGEEVVQLYLKDEKASTPRPIHQLEGFQRLHLNEGESKIVDFELTPHQFSMIGENDKRVIENGWFTIYTGGGQPGNKNSGTVSARLQLTGENVEIEN
jgi:beta-glucosidase